MDNGSLRETYGPRICTYHYIVKNTVRCAANIKNGNGMKQHFVLSDLCMCWLFLCFCTRMYKTNEMVGNNFNEFGPQSVDQIKFNWRKFYFNLNKPLKRAHKYNLFNTFLANIFISFYLFALRIRRKI